MRVFETDLAWLAGIWDGEGAVGVCRNGGSDHSLKVSVQLSHTCPETVRVIRAVLQRMGISAVGYTYQERDPAKQKDANYLRVNRMNDVRTFALAMLPYSVTKREQWSLALEFVNLRLDGTTIDELGRIHRAGNSRHWWRPYGPREWEIAARLRELNERGPRRPGFKPFIQRRVGRTPRQRVKS